MIDEVSDVLGWNRKHATKALNGKVSLGQKARRRGSKATYSEAETAVIVGIWKHSEQPCGNLLPLFNRQRLQDRPEVGSSGWKVCLSR